MNAWLVSGEAAWQLAGWTMLHFLWVGAIVALVGVAMRVACRRARPGVRYGVSLLTLAGLAAAPVGIAIWLAGQGLERYGLGTNGVSGDFESRTSASSVELRDSSRWAGRDPRSRPHEEPRVIDLAQTPIVVEDAAGGVKSEVIEIQAPSGISFDAVASYLPWVWLAGAPVTFALLATGLVGSRRLRRQCAAVTEGAAFEALERIKKLMRVTRRVALAACEHVAQPVLVGIVRPTILLPAAALTGWSPEELEMVLVHELAHVRRWDNLVNLWQRLVESALFFHPAVWLASRQVRRDREECCDAAVVAHTRRPTEYAELLVSIAARGPRGRAQRAAKASLALASAMVDHPLAGRIRRILKLEDEPMWVSRSTIGLVFVLGASLLAAVLALPPTGGAVADDASSPSPVAAATDGGEEEAQDAPRASTPRPAQNVEGEQVDAWGEEKPGWERPLLIEDELEVELPKLKNDIALYQSQLLQLQKEQEDIEALKDKALQDARSPAALKAAVAAEIRKDPTIAKYQQQLFKVQQDIQQQAAPGRRDPKSARLQELMAQRNQTEAMLKQYQEQAEKAARERLANVPNEALRSAMVEYQNRAASIATRKAELEQKLKAAEDRITEMAAGNGEAAARPKGTTQSAAERARAARATYADAGSPNFEMAQVQERILTYQAALMAQEKESQDLEVRKQLAAMQAQRAANSVARVEEELEKDRRTKIYEDEAIELEKHLRALKGETTQASQERYEHVKTQYEQLLAEADEYRQEASRKYRERLEKLAQEMLDSSRVEYEIHAQALERRHAELAKKLNEAEAQFKELAQSAKERAASASRDNRYFYYSNQPRQMGAGPESSEGGTPAGQPYQQNQPSQPASQVPAINTQPAGLPPAAAYTAPAKPAGGKRTLQAGDVLRVSAIGVAPERPLNDVFGVEAEGTLPLGPMYGRVKVAGLTVLGAQEAIKGHLAKTWDEPSVQVVLASPELWTGLPTPKPGPSTRLFYDSKSFEQWQQLWQNELKTEKRTEAIEALAAFGRAGMANEAAEAILEVAGQYDFYSIDHNSQEGQLKNQVIQLLTATNTSRLRESAWLPALMRRLDADPARWKWLAWQLLNNLIAEDEAVREPLFKLAASQDEDIRKAARWALANSDPTRTDPKVMAEIVRLVGSDDAEEIKTGINMLVYAPKLPGGQRFQPPKLRNAANVVPHLFHHDESVQQTAREALMSIDRADAEPIVADLLERLNESDDLATKLAAVRGLAAIGPDAKDAEAVMRELIVGAEPSLAAAATVAVDLMHPGAGPGTGSAVLWKYLNNNPTAPNRSYFDEQTIQRERETLFTPRDGRGGGGLGGGELGGGRRGGGF